MSWHVGVGGPEARAHSPPTCPTPTPHRLETLSMRLTALLVRVLVYLGIVPDTKEGLSKYLET